MMLHHTATGQFALSLSLVLTIARSLFSTLDRLISLFALTDRLTSTPIFSFIPSSPSSPSPPV